MRVVLAFAVCCFLSLAAVAQAPNSMPTPTPQHQMMGYFAGNWKIEGTMKVSPSSPAGAFSGTEHGEWVPGGFFVETHSSMKSPLGSIRGVRVLGYNSDDNTYTYNAYNSIGEHQLAVGHVNGNVWSWVSEEKMNGVVVKGRYTVNVTSPTSYTFTGEVASPSGEWSTVMQGKATRTQ